MVIKRERRFLIKRKVTKSTKAPKHRTCVRRKADKSCANNNLAGIPEAAKRNALANKRSSPLNLRTRTLYIEIKLLPKLKGVFADLHN